MLRSPFQTAAAETPNAYAAGAAAAEFYLSIKGATDPTALWFSTQNGIESTVRLTVSRLDGNPFLLLDEIARQRVG